MFSKILIANRGEIAVRIIRACKEMGIATVAVYSEADKNALHVALADQCYCIGGAEASDSYLNENQIISAAVLAGAQAIHPGYGFLSENAHFARACRRNGLVFIGPDPESMERLSDKAILKALIRDTGLSVIPGTKAVASVLEEPISSSFVYNPFARIPPIMAFAIFPKPIKPIFILITMPFSPLSGCLIHQYRGCHCRIK